MRRILVALLLAGSASALVAAPATTVSYFLSVHSKPKYPAGFTHFDYVNPDAPRGGTLRLGSIGSFDNLNRYADRGDYAANSDSFYDTLMTASEDEQEVYYGLVADKVEYPQDFSWIIFSVNPKARFQDGTAITADDVVFSFDKFMKEGVSQFGMYYKDVKAEALDKLRAKFTLPKGDKAMMVSFGNSIPIIPKKFWSTRKITDPLTEVPLGSGAYTLKDYKMGQYLVYERRKDYWGLDLPVNKGQLNFDYIRYDYYKDETVSFEAFKAGQYDFYSEHIAKQWATAYKGPNFDNGAIVKETLPDQSPQGMQAMVFNIQKPFFKDRRVRQALNYALDFEWMNKNLFYGQYTRTRSYFGGTDYEARELPTGEELKVLEKLRGKIPDEVFTTEYKPPVTDGTGNIRDQIRDALALLKQAGWEVKDGKLVNVSTGEPFVFELLLWNSTDERVALPLKNNLARMGVTMNIRLVDTAQFQSRWTKGDFDMVSGGFDAIFYPGPDLKIVWRSDYIDSTYNQARVQDPAVDALIDGIVANQENDPQLLAYGRGLDRVLTWNFYVIPQWHLDKYRIAYWNKFSRPAVQPKYSMGFGSWWLDGAKEAKLPKR
jgi:microcin C transport system substrate-binding protein